MKYSKWVNNKEKKIENYRQLPIKYRMNSYLQNSVSFHTLTSLAII